MMVSTSPTRHMVAVLLVIALALIGVGRGIALASGMPSAATITIGGVEIAICHGGDGDHSNGPAGTQHDCCDTCVLLAPVLLSTPPQLVVPMTVIAYVEHAIAMSWVPAFARTRSPRQSQGPPIG